MNTYTKKRYSKNSQQIDNDKGTGNGRETIKSTGWQEDCRASHNELTRASKE